MKIKTNVKAGRIGFVRVSTPWGSFNEEQKQIRTAKDGCSSYQQRLYPSFLLL